MNFERQKLQPLAKKTNDQHGRVSPDVLVGSHSVNSDLADILDSENSHGFAIHCKYVRF
jgi:hypothetical protein